MEKTIDLNSDLGEHPGTGLDVRIMPFLSSCNIACGGHIGDEDSVAVAVKLAKHHGVSIGAHPSYTDKANFGRVEMDISKEVLTSSLLHQISAVKRACSYLRVPLHHVKPHGALYNLAAKDAELSRLICKVIKRIDPHLRLFGLAHSMMETVAKEEQIGFVPEGFSDRRYEANKTLKPRSKKGAVLTEEAQVLKQVEEMVMKNRVFANDWVTVKARTLCLHSDTQGAVNLAEKIRNHLENKGVRITTAS